MKKFFLLSLLLSCLSISMTSCFNGYDDNNMYQVDPYSYKTTYRDMRLYGNGYLAEQYSQIINNGKTNYAIKDVKALVIPVSFLDYPANNLPKGAEGSRKQLENVIFGKENETAWQSLSSYYNSSSFGQCQISGDVGDWWYINQTAENFARENGENGSQIIAKNVQDYYHEQYINALNNHDLEAQNKYDLSQYDANQDGYVDALLLIYSAPITNYEDLYWAFCWSRVDNPSGGLTPSTCATYRFFWASYWFFYDQYLEHGDKEQKIPSDLPNKIQNDLVNMDSHTIIHEFGHVLGLPDYYVTDYNEDDYSGLGGLDMMDYNIGDHHAMSKAWFGWLNPYIVKGSVKAKIRSTTDYGDVILIPARGKYKNTLLDQFIMIEFLTPTGVAKYDGLNKYNGKYPYYYNKAGIRVTHVDARLGVYSYNRITTDFDFQYFTDNFLVIDKYSYVTTACSNTMNDSCFENYKLLEILPKSGRSIKGYVASNNSLYYQGDSFGKNGVFDNYQMHGENGKNNVSFGFNFTISKISGNDYAEITINENSLFNL